MKYKIRYKATDHRTIYELAVIIESFYKSRLEEKDAREMIHAWSSLEDVFVLTWIDSRVDTNFTLKVQMPFRQVSKHQIDNRFYAAMNSDELKFFDGLDFDLDPLYAKATKQDITDWFGEK